jgi:hypothetical protein
LDLHASGGEGVLIQRLVSSWSYIILAGLWRCSDVRSLALLGRVSMCRIFVDYDAPIEKGVFLVEHIVHAC